MRVLTRAAYGALQARGGRPSCSHWPVLDHPEHPEETFLAHVRASFDSDCVAENDQAPAAESICWRSGFGAVTR